MGTIATTGIEVLLTVLLGVIAFLRGRHLGWVLLKKGATANNLFKGKTWISLAFLGFYVGLLVLALYVPQVQVLPLEWRVYGMQVTWTLIRVILIGFCGLAWIVSWRTARTQVVAVVLLGILGLSGFTAVEAYFLAPIYPSLKDNLQPNGVFLQTSASSCAPSALANILRLWGLDATESNVAKLAGTNRLGTSMPQIIVAAQGFGMDGIELSPTWEQMRQINRPGVLASWLQSDTAKEAHAIALQGMSEDAVVIADSSFGEIYQVSRPQFETIWRKEYVPIFRPSDAVLAPDQATQLLYRSGYLPQPQVASVEVLKAAIQSFQRAMGVPDTGELDTETILLLTGPFLTGVPTLKDGF